MFYYSQNGDSTVKHWDAEVKYAEWNAKSGWKASSLLSWNSHVLILSCCSYQKTLTNSITWITPDGCVIHTKLWGLSLLSYKNMWRHRSRRIEITVPWNDLCERKSKSLVNEHQRPAALWRRTECRYSHSHATETHVSVLTVRRSILWWKLRQTPRPTTLLIFAEQQHCLQLVHAVLISFNQMFFVGKTKPQQAESIYLKAQTSGSVLPVKSFQYFMN